MRLLPPPVGISTTASPPDDELVDRLGLVAAERLVAEDRVQRLERRRVARVRGWRGAVRRRRRVARCGCQASSGGGAQPIVGGGVPAIVGGACPVLERRSSSSAGHPVDVQRRVSVGIAHGSARRVVAGRHRVRPACPRADAHAWHPSCGARGADDRSAHRAERPERDAPEHLMRLRRNAVGTASGRAWRRYSRSTSVIRTIAAPCLLRRRQVDLAADAPVVIAGGVVDGLLDLPDTAIPRHPTRRPSRAAASARRRRCRSRRARRSRRRARRTSRRPDRAPRARRRVCSAASCTRRNSSLRTSTRKARRFVSTDGGAGGTTGAVGSSTGLTRLSHSSTSDESTCRTSSPSHAMRSSSSEVCASAGTVCRIARYASLRYRSTSPSLRASW